MDRLKSFEYVIVIAETGSITDAAESLGIAQSALSRYIIRLEKELGVELFDRSTLPIILTEAGRYYVEAGMCIYDAYRQLEKKLQNVKIYKNLEIRIGIGPSRAPALLPVILNSFSASFPDVRVLTDECRTAELTEKLTTGKLDLIITFLDHTTENFVMEDLFAETVELAVPPNYSEDVKKSLVDDKVVVSTLSVPFVSLHEGQQLRNALDILSRSSIIPHYVCDYQESAMALVNQGFGVTLVPSYWKLVDNRNLLTYYPISIPNNLSITESSRLMEIINRRICIFYRKEQFLSEAEIGFIKSAKKICANI